MKRAAVWDADCRLVQVDGRFGVVYYLHQGDDEGSTHL
jgi:hypothetical protein